jgi:dynein heavy chain
MYEYSLGSYMTVFMNALSQSRKDNILASRLKIIKEYLTTLVYDFTCMGIFERHKLMFSFKMTTMIMDGDDELNQPELNFFLKGNTSLDEIDRKKPYEWISDNGWKDINMLETLGEAWTGFIDNLVNSGKAWKDWYDLDSPETSPIPNGYTDKLSKFQTLLLMRVIRPDRVINQIKLFIAAQMNNDYYVKSPLVNYAKVY